MPEDYQNLCEKCRNRKSCKAPCAFVERILSEDNKTPFFEQNDKAPDGKLIKVAKSKNHRHEVNESNLDQADERFYDDETKATPFTTEADNPFEMIEAKLSQTTVFINRFFLRRDYADIAAELDVTVDTVVSMFHNAKERLFEALGFADDRHSTIQRYKSLLKRNEKSFGRLPKGQRWYLMNQVLGLTVPEIADLDGSYANRVRSGIKDVSDRLKTGNLIWLDCSQTDREAAQARIDGKRQRDRKRSEKSKAAA